MHEEAKELNEIIRGISPTTHDVLSEKGKNIYFPKQGILSQTAEAKGKSYNATIGQASDEDNTPMRLRSIESQMQLKPQDAFPYTPSSGKPELRNAWKKMILEKNPGLQGKEISLPVTTNAITHGLNIAAYLFLDPSEEILVPDLYWENYDLIFEYAYGAKIKTYPLFKGKSLDLDAFDTLMCSTNGKKKVVLFNFPNNPTGYSPSKTEAKSIVESIRKSAQKENRIVVIIDDAYFGLFYEDETENESLFSQLADIHENVIAMKLDAATKEDYVWGFRVGFITFGTRNGNVILYSALEAKTAGIIRGNVSNVSNVSQSLLVNAYSANEYSKEKTEKYEILKKRYDTVRETLSNNKYAEVFEPLSYNSGYFMCVRVNPKIDCEQLRRLLIGEFDTGVINIAGVIRIAYSSLQTKKIPELFENIYKAGKKILDD
jgi:aspartate/methionine/tyrosine aminotransferase